jgi:hypothetical protein
LPGPESFLGHFVENLLSHGEIRHRSLEAGILGFEFLEALTLVDPHALRQR